MAIRFERAGAEELETLLVLMRGMQEADPWEEEFNEARVRPDLRALLENEAFGVAFIAWDLPQAESLQRSAEQKVMQTEKWGEEQPDSRTEKRRQAAALQKNAVGYLVICFDYSLEYGGKGAWVDELFVAAEHRGKGIGTELLDLAETVSRELGARMLHLEVSHGNRAVELYQRRGFVDHRRFLMSKWLVG